MKKALYILSALSIMLLPVGFAFAQGGMMLPPQQNGEGTSLGGQQNGPGPQMMRGDQQEGQQGGDRWSIPVRPQQDNSMMGGSKDTQNRPDIASSSEGDQQWASSTPRGAEGMPWLNGMKRGIMRHFGTTTPPGFFEHPGSSSDESASSSNDHKAWFSGVPQFWKWLFGGNNSVTASSSQQLPPPQNQNQGENNNNGSSTQEQTQPGPAFWGGFFERLKSLF